MKLKKLVNVTLGLLLLTALDAQIITQAHFDSIWNQARPLPDQLEAVDSLALSIDPYGNLLPIKQLQKALYLSEQSAQILWINRLRLSMGSVYSTIDVQDSAKIYLHRALDGLQNIGTRNDIARCYRELSWLYTFIPEYDRALDFGFSARDQYAEAGNEEQEAVMNSRIAFIWQETGQQEKALPLLLAAEPVLSRYQNLKNLGYTYMRMANFYEWAGEMVKAGQAYDQYVTTMERLASGWNGYVTMALLRRGTYYRKLKAYDRAEDDLKSAVAIAEAKKNNLVALVSTYNLGCLYAEMRQYDRAVPLLEAVVRQVDQSSSENEYFFWASTSKRCTANWRMLTAAWGNMRKLTITSCGRPR